MPSILKKKREKIVLFFKSLPLLILFGCGVRLKCSSSFDHTLSRRRANLATALSRRSKTMPNSMHSYALISLSLNNMKMFCCCCYCCCCCFSLSLFVVATIRQFKEESASDLFWQLSCFISCFCIVTNVCYE